MSRKTPLSVDDLLKAQREAAAVKPKFLSKAERQRLAQEREQASSTAAASAKKDQAAKAAAAAAAAPTHKGDAERNGKPNGGLSEAEQALIRARYLGHASAAVPLPSNSAAAAAGPRADRDRYQGGRNGGGGAGGGGGHHHRNNGPPGRHHNSSSSSSSAPPPPPTAAAAANLGANGLPLKKKRKTGDKKFVFDWDKDEDTSERVNPIYQAASSTFSARPLGQSSSTATASSDPDHRARGSSSNTSVGKLAKSRKTILKELHWSEKTLEEMAERDWRIFREDFAIAARGGNIPRPLRSWKESRIPGLILRAIEAIGYKEPSPIQRQAIPIGLQNRDLIGIAETGEFVALPPSVDSSFVIPMLAYISDLPPLTDENRHLGPYALILAPTRELAQQIEGETNKFASELNLTCVSIVGGRDANDQAHNLRNGAEIIIATPGRLVDLLERHVVVLSQCMYVVMDEADRMVHEGFEEALGFILDSLPVSNLKPDTEEAEDPLARLGGVAVGTVEQNVEFINGEEKRKARLLSILSSGFQPPIIVFVNQKKTADMIGKYIQNAGWSTAVLHSGKTQPQREAALESLRSGDCLILVATDLAGRGIDVPDVSLVINFQMSNAIEAYVHRIGRTGRAGKRGTAITFVDGGDEEVLYDLKVEIGRSPVSKVSNELARHPAAQAKVPRSMRAMLE
ncbi:unnamed protein product [Tilletia caries]|nr:unnamed protein product [Tilletia caries]